MFKLGTFQKPNHAPFAAIVLGDNVVDLALAQKRFSAAARRGALSATGSILELLENWDANFARAAGDRGISRQGRVAARR
jgi:hypothetical protein